MIIETQEFDTIVQWTTDSILFIQTGQWTNEDGVDSSGQIIPGAIVIRSPSADSPLLKISWPESTVQHLLERVPNIKEPIKCICERLPNGEIVRAMDCPKHHGSY